MVKELINDIFSTQKLNMSISFRLTLCIFKYLKAGTDVFQ